MISLRIIFIAINHFLRNENKRKMNKKYFFSVNIPKDVAKNDFHMLLNIAFIFLGSSSKYTC